MRLVCLADTHNLHHHLPIPEGDVLIHAGDCTDGGTRNETNNFLRWMQEQPHPYKILIPGNHDFFFEKKELLRTIPHGIHVLLDQELVIQGKRFWGSPVTPGMINWAFNRERGKAMQLHWDLIPRNVDVLITHTPPYGIMDQIESGERLGCEDLLKTLKDVQPAVHLFGHIHYSSGFLKRENTAFYNLSILDESGRIMQSPLVIDT